MYDTYMIHKNIDIYSNDCNFVLNNCVILRNVDNKDKKIVVKKKIINDVGEILSQSNTNCKIYDIDETRAIFEKLGYVVLMSIEDKSKVYINGEFKIVIQDVKDQATYIEIETCINSILYDSIEKLKNTLINLNLPVDTSNYYVKKAVIALENIKNIRC